MKACWLLGTGDDQTRATMILEIHSESSKPLVPRQLACRAYFRKPSRSPDSVGDSDGEALYFAGTQRHSMIRHRARIRRCALDDVKAIHPPRGIRIAPRSETARIPNAAGAGTEEIRVERKNHVGAVNSVNGVDRLAKCQPRALACRAAPARLVLMPLRRRKFDKQRAHLRRQRARGDRLGENAQT